MLKILHVAPQNYAGVPYSFFKMHNAMGDYSRIVTLHKNPHEFPEDICLNLPLPSSPIAKFWRKKKIKSVESGNNRIVPEFKPKNFIEKIYFSLNDINRKKIIENAIKEYKLDQFDIIHYDAGLDFYRNSSQAKKWKQQGKKIVCCYYGSDLRIRGIIKEMDELSDLNITSEYDHLTLKNDLHYIFYPYDISELPVKSDSFDGTVKIVHSPTNRKYKGTELILSVIEKIKKEKKIEFILLEGKPRSEVLQIKSKCDISIDQVGGTMGGTGYGKAGLETLGMGIPTITNMTKDYSDWLPENPFSVSNNEKELYQTLNELIDSAQLRNEKGLNGKSWVKKYHGFKQVNDSLMELYKLNNIV